MREAQARCDSSEFSEWQAYQSIRGPLGVQAGYLQAAWIAMHVIGSQAAKGQKIKLDDFLLKFDEQQSRGRMTPKQMMAVMNSIPNVKRL